MKLGWVSVWLKSVSDLHMENETALQTEHEDLLQ